MILDGTGGRLETTCSAAAIAVLLASIGASVARVSDLHGWTDLLPAEGLDASLALLGTCKAALATWLLSRAGRGWIVRAFAALTATEALRAGTLLLAPAVSIPLPGWLPAVLGGVLHGALAIALGLLVGLAHLGVGTAIIGSREQARGYRLPLVIGSFAVSAAAATVVVDTFLYLSLAFFDLSLLGFVLASRCCPSLALDTPARVKGFVAAGLVAPLAVFVGSVAFNLAALIGTNRGLLQEMAESRSTPMAEVATWSGSLEYVPARASAVHTRTAFNDVWFVDHDRAFAVDRGALYASDDGAVSWQQIRDLRVPGIEVRFAADGQRGWTGDPWSAVELTRDGGRSWRRLDLLALYREQVGKAPGGFSSSSLLHLDPETGRGGVVIGCRFFATTDFARTWAVTRLDDADDRRLCLAESPLALDAAAGLALVTSLGDDLLYRRDPATGRWEQRCGLDEEAMAIRSGEVCATLADLADVERAFLEGLEREDEITGRVTLATAHVRRILAGRPLTADIPARGAGPQRRWLSAPGLLLTSGDRGRTWVVRQHVPALSTVHPVDAERALAWNRSLEPFVSVDGGGVWLPLHGGEREVLDLRFDQGGWLWLLLDGGLVRHGVWTGERQRVLTFEPDEQPQVLRMSHDARRIWTFARDGGAHTSGDGGESWHRLAFDLAEGRSIVDVHCPAAAGCVAILDDGRVVRPHTGPRAGIRAGEVGRLPEQARAESGFLFEQQDTLLFLPEEGRVAFASDDAGATWRARPFATEQVWSRPVRSGDASSLILPGEDVMVMVGEVDSRWAAVAPSGWDAPIDFCWSHSGAEVYLNDGTHLAWTHDRGESWRRTTVRDGVAPYCGFGPEHLWIQHGGVTVYHLAPAGG